MNEVRRISVQEARQRLMSGARLVCAYDSEEEFGEYHLEGAISLAALKNLAPRVSKSDEIIFYCA